MYQINEIAEISKTVDSSWGLTVIRNKRYVVGSVYVKLNCPTAISDTVNMLVSAQNMHTVIPTFNCLLYTPIVCFIELSALILTNEMSALID